MYKTVAFAAIFVLAVPLFETLRCPTCRGEYCDNEIVHDLDCTKLLTSQVLPHNVYCDGREEKDAEYACLDLEYSLLGSDGMKIKQCFIMKRGRDVCGQIKKSLSTKEALQKCVVTLDEKEDNTTTTEIVTTTTTEMSQTSSTVTSTTPEATSESENTTGENTTVENSTTTSVSSDSTVTTVGSEDTTASATTTANSTSTPEGGSSGVSPCPHLSFLLFVFVGYIHRRI